MGGRRVSAQLLPPDFLKQLQALQANKQFEQRVQTYGKWVGLGKEIGLAVNEGLQALTKTADDFSKTGVGKFTMFLIAWKVVGTDFLQIFFGTIFFLTGFTLFVWSWWVNARTRRIVVGVDEKGNARYEVAQPSDGVQVGHAIWFIAFILLTTLIIFV